MKVHLRYGVLEKPCIFLIEKDKKFVLGTEKITEASDELGANSTRTRTFDIRVFLVIYKDQLVLVLVGLSNLLYIFLRLFRKVNGGLLISASFICASTYYSIFALCTRT